jgi:hypothetical protein
MPDNGRDPADVLADLAAAVPGVEPVVLESLGPPADAPGEVTESALDFLFRRLQNSFRVAVSEVDAEWGPPAFVGSVEEESFPAWSDALLLAVWLRGGVTTYLALRHEAPQDPLTLEAGALTEDEVAELLRWHPDLSEPPS